MPRQPRIHQRLHLPPRAHVVLVDVRLGVRIARAHIAPRRVVVRKRPVHQIKIEILQPQILQRLLARPAHVAVLVVPHLRRDPEILALVAGAGIARQTPRQCDPRCRTLTRSQSAGSQPTPHIPPPRPPARASHDRTQTFPARSPACARRQPESAAAPPPDRLPRHSSQLQSSWHHFQAEL